MNLEVAGRRRRGVWRRGRCHAVRVRAARRRPRGVPDARAHRRHVHHVFLRHTLQPRVFVLEHHRALGERLRLGLRRLEQLTQLVAPRFQHSRALALGVQLGRRGGARRLRHRSRLGGGGFQRRQSRRIRRDFGFLLALARRARLLVAPSLLRDRRLLRAPARLRLRRLALRAHLLLQSGHLRRRLLRLLLALRLRLRQAPALELGARALQLKLLLQLGLRRQERASLLRLVPQPPRARARRLGAPRALERDGGEARAQESLASRAPALEGLQLHRGALAPHRAHARARRGGAAGGLDRRGCLFAPVELAHRQRRARARLRLDRRSFKPERGHQATREHASRPLGDAQRRALHGVKLALLFTPPRHLLNKRRRARHALVPDHVQARHLARAQEHLGLPGLPQREARVV